MSGGCCRFLLRGEIAGGERAYFLRPGLNQVGRLDGNQVVLEVDGLSKRHAALLVEPGRITVQDLASKNGTFVNGRRVVDAEVRPGDEIGFGPARLTLHAAAPGEAELAIELTAGSAAVAPRLDGETTLTASAAGARDGWRAVLRFPDGHVAGESAPMRELYRQMAAVARSELPVLIAGETGVGKEAVARALHASSPRAGRPLVAVNCAAIPRELLEAELFGVAAGAATGVAPRPGVFRAADGGTVLLDEIGEMPLALQSKLLRALEEKEVQPVGGAPAAADVRVLAATNAGLSESLDRGRFRRDLYYRLAGCVLRVPALRERREDVPLLVEHFLRRAAREAGSGVRGLTAGRSGGSASTPGRATCASWSTWSAGWSTWPRARRRSPRSGSPAPSAARSSPRPAAPDPPRRPATSTSPRSSAGRSPRRCGGAAATRSGQRASSGSRASPCAAGSSVTAVFSGGFSSPPPHGSESRGAPPPSRRLRRRSPCGLRLLPPAAGRRAVPHDEVRERTGGRPS